MKFRMNREKQTVSITMTIEEANGIMDGMSSALQAQVGSAPDRDCAEQYSLNDADAEFTRVVEEANRRLGR